MIMAAVESGPVGTWAGAIATVLVVITTALVALATSTACRVRGCGSPSRPPNHGRRQGKTEEDGTALWARVGVEILGARPARGCLGRLVSVATNSEVRPDVDPVQLRWAAAPTTLCSLPRQR